MRLSTADTQSFANLRVKITAGGISPSDLAKYDALVVKMHQPEPRPKRAAAKATTAKKPAK